MTKTGVMDTGSSIWPSRPWTVWVWPNASVMVAVAAGHGQVTVTGGSSSPPNVSRWSQS